jgi:hypothetical protein
MRDDCALVDELLRQLADYKNDVADMAAEKLLRKCSTSWESYQYLLDRVHDVWLPDSPGSRCDRLSNGYKCRFISLANTGGRMSSRDARVRG